MFCKGRIGAEPHRRKQEFTRHSLRSELEIVPTQCHLGRSWNPVNIMTISTEDRLTSGENARLSER